MMTNIILSGMNRLSGHVRKLDNIKQKLYYLSGKTLQGKKHQLSKYIRELEQGAGKYLEWNRQKTEMFTPEMTRLAKQYFTVRKHQLTILGKSLSYLDPVNVLSRGYSITRFRGHALKRSKDVGPGELLNTKLFEGEIKSKTIK